MDLQTVRSEHVVLLALTTVLTLVNRRINKGTKGMHWFAGYTLCFVVGAMLVALRGSISDWFSVMLGNQLVMVAYSLLYLSVSEVVGRTKSNLYFHGCFVAFATVWLLQFEMTHPDPHSRTTAFSLVLALQEAQIAFFLYRRRDTLLHAAGTPMAYMLTGLTALNTVRVTGVLLHGRLAEALASQTFLAWMVAISSSLQCGIVVAYVWMTASLLRRDLEVQATTDPLTGLLNRRALEHLSASIIAELTKVSAPVWAILMDLDGFKEINDTLGHGCGDETLIGVAKCLRAGARQHDLIARLGGDEFALVLQPTSMQEAKAIAEGLRTSIASMEVRSLEPTAHVTTSIGLVAAHPQLGWDQLITNCDHAMYAAKRAGGDRIVCTKITSPVHVTDTSSSGAFAQAHFSI